MLRILYADCRLLSLAILSHSWNVRWSQKLKKNRQNFFFSGSRSFKVIDDNKTKKPVTSACYDKQHVSTYLQLFSR